MSTKKKMKKGSRLVRALKKLLCCCWCKTQQQDEEADECVVVDSPSQDEGEQDGVRESGSLADSSSEPAPSLPVMCGQSPECESDQSLPEECMVLEDPAPAGPEADVQTSSEEDFLSASEGNGEPFEENTHSPPEDVQETEQAALIDEPLTAKISALSDESLKPEATRATAEPAEHQGQAARQTARRRRRKKKKVLQEEEEDKGGEWQLVCKKPRRKKTETTAVQEQETPASKPPKPEPQRVSHKPKEQRRAIKAPQDERGRVRLSWQETTVKVAVPVPVPPDRRRHVIGTRGDTIHQLQQQYPAVRMSVPGPQDRTSREVIIEGPKTQAEAAALHITRSLQATEEKLREAEQRRQERKRIVLKVEVPPDMRRHVVGPRGETLRRLAQQHPAARVTVPAPSDTRTATVSISGPREEAAAVAECIRACVQAARRPQRQRQPHKRKQ